MFCWNEDMIRFLRDASEQSDYHRLLAARIARELPENARVCDAGCGLGYLSLRLAPYCRQITAVDRSAEALAVLERNIAAGGPRNITPLCGEIENLPPREPYDVMVFCFFGTAEETLRLARAQCRGRVIIIQKGWSEHRFSLGRKKMNHRSYADTLALLKELEIPCRCEKLTLEMGQPFRSLRDACRFFELYENSGAAVTEEAVRARLTPTGRQAFPWYLPQPKEMGFITLETGDLPDSINRN